MLTSVNVIFSQFPSLFIYLFYDMFSLVFPFPSRCETTPVYRKVFFNKEGLGWRRLVI